MRHISDPRMKVGATTASNSKQITKGAIFFQSVRPSKELSEKRVVNFL